MNWLLSEDNIRITWGTKYDQYLPHSQALPRGLGTRLDQYATSEHFGVTEKVQLSTGRSLLSIIDAGPFMMSKLRTWVSGRFVCVQY